MILAGCGAADDQTGSVDFEALFDQAPCGYLVTGDDGVITAVNDTFAHWSGYGRDTLLGTNLSRLMPVGDRILYSTQLAPRLRIAGAVAEVVIAIVAADGSRRAALLSATRTAACGSVPAQTRVIIFSAAERVRYEEELVSALRRAHESEALRVDAEAGLQHLATHDPLTGLPNRLGLIGRLEDALRERGDRSLAVLSIGIDHFKAINDSLGHAAGDELLIVLAGRLGALTRESSTVSRVGADEFVILDQTDVGRAAVLGQRILDALRAPVILEGLEVVISAGIGAAVADVATDTADALLRRADIAMYRAKSRGPNSFEVHDRSRADPEVDHFRRLGELRAGIAAGELRLHYQPRVELRHTRFAGVEALVRWQHPTLGLLPPSEFIEIAERSGLIRELGAWVLQHAVAQAAQWNRDGVTDARCEMAVNLSTRQLAQTDIVELVQSALHDHDLDARQLTLEITETALMSDPDAALKTLTQLKALGVNIAIDDFGTGFGSLTYLQRFPIDELKIDRSFVTALGTENDGEDSAIVAACVQLAHAVGVHALAEGVETEAQRDALIDLGCELAQGYLFSRPLTAPDLGEWLTRPSTSPVGSINGPT